MTATVNRSSAAKTISQAMLIIMACVLFVSVLMVQNVSIAFCADADNTNADSESAILTASDVIVNIVNLVTNRVYGTFLKATTPLVAVAFAIAGIQFFSTNQRSTDNAIKTAKHAVIALFVIVFAPPIAGELASWLKDVYTGNIGDYNPF